MTAVHEANYKPKGRKPIKDWARSPEEEAQFQKMQAICLKNSNGSSGVDSDTQGSGVALNPSLPTLLRQAECNSPPAASICWTRTSSHTLESTDKSYQIQKFIPDEAPHGRVEEWRYQVWFRVPSLWYIQVGPRHESGDAARDFCERHLKGKTLK
jgi:hypothetical protein